MYCCIKGCELPARALGMCKAHYDRARTGRDMSAPLRQVIRTGSDVDRLLAKTTVNEGTGCWEWMASVNTNGYGQFRFRGRPHQAHRASWMLHYGEIPDGMYVLHKCDNPLCVRPEHLFLGTQSANLLDAGEKNRWGLVRAAGEKHGRAVVGEKEVREMRASSDPARVLAERYCISVGAVRHILKRRTWQQVD